jgi:hypothetical protein
MKRAVTPLCRYLPIGAAVLGLAVLPAGAPAHAADNHSEAAVKAAYLYRFAGYVDWPDDASSTEPFTIAVLGSPAVARELKGLLPNHYVNSRPARVREVKGVRDLGRPQILFVGSGYADALRLIMPAVSREPMLLVTDEEEGLNQGSVLNFVTVDRRVRFEVSLTAADRLRLKISSELLTVAVRVRGGHRQSRDGCLPLTSPDATDGECRMRAAHIGALHQFARSGRSGERAM